jgi:hypothetical protein
MSAFVVLSSHGHENEESVLDPCILGLATKVIPIIENDNKRVELLARNPAVVEQCQQAVCTFKRLLKQDCESTAFSE